jgi:ketosteroid isomerase-like protein
VSAENVELLRRYYESWNDGDVESVVAVLSDEVAWHAHPRLPEPGPYTDPAEVGRWMKQFREAWGELHAQPVELLDAGDGVVALIHMSGRGRGSGVAVQGGVDVHVVGFEDHMVRYFRILPADEAAELAGLTESEMDVLVLRIQEEMSEEEIAARRGEDPAAVLTAAYDKLRALPRGAAE